MTTMVNTRRRAAWLLAAAFSCATTLTPNLTPARASSWAPAPSWPQATATTARAAPAPADSAAIPAPDDSAAARWAPAKPLAAIHLIEPDRRAGSLREFLASRKLQDSPVYQLIATNPGLLQAQIGLLGIAAAAGMDGWTAVSHVLGKDAVVGLYTGSGDNAEPELLIVSIARDAAARTKFVNAAATAAGLMKGGEPDPAKTTRVADHTVFTLGQLHYCQDGDAMIFAGSIKLLERALAARSNQDNLALSGELDSAEDAAPAGAMAVAAFDVKKLVRDSAANAGNPEGLIGNPLGGFLFGAWSRSFAQGNSAVAWIEEIAGGLSMTMRVDRGELPDSYKGFIPDFGAMAIDWNSFRLPHQIASVSIPRDWASLFSEREQILTLPAAADAANFAATMTTLMGNLDFLEDFLPRVNGPVRFFLERQDYTDAAYAPAPRLPAFALVAPLKGASEDMMKQRLMSGSQMALSFINYDAAQKQKPGFLMGMGEHRGVTILKGTYPAPGTAAAGSMMKKDGAPPADDDDAATDRAAQPAGAEVDIRYNFEPVVAVAADHYLVATSMTTMRSLIDAVLDGKPAAAASASDELQLTGDQGAALLRENREELIVNRMLEQDEDRAQAEKMIDGVLWLAEMVDHATFVSRPTDTGQEATVTFVMRDSPSNAPAAPTANGSSK
ncbi:MAG: hypothetical protein AMXMBFR58_37950 [Phycisphaerae bacterium]